MPTFVIDSAALSRNMEKLRRFTSAQIIAVVKGNGYALGLVPYARFLTAQGVALLAVSTVEEAAALRDAGITAQLLMLSSTALPEEIAARMQDLLTRCDAVITSGGVSVGQKDYLPTVLDMLHVEPVFAGVAQKPGSPMLAGTVGGKLVFCLSGNPFAAAATLEQYAVPALLRAAGRREEDCIPVHTRGRLTTGFSKPSKGTRFLRARALGGLVEIPGEGSTEAHSSGSLSAMMGCNCLVELPAGSGPVAPGEEVEVLSFVQ